MFSVSDSSPLDSSDLNSRFSDEEYLIWKKNSPFLYDLLVSHSLEWPSLTVEWFPDKFLPEGRDYHVQRILCGTHTGFDQKQKNQQNLTESDPALSAPPNSILIVEIRLPLVDDDLIAGQSEELREGEGGGYGRKKFNFFSIFD